MAGEKLALIELRYPGGERGLGHRRHSWLASLAESASGTGVGASGVSLTIRHPALTTGAACCEPRDAELPVPGNVCAHLPHHPRGACRRCLLEVACQPVKAGPERFRQLVGLQASTLVRGNGEAPRQFVGIVRKGF